MKKLFLLAILLINGSLLLGMEEGNISKVPKSEGESNIEAYLQQLPNDLKMEILQILPFAGEKLLPHWDRIKTTRGTQELLYEDLVSKIQQIHRLKVNKSWYDKIQNDEMLNQYFVQYLKNRYENEMDAFVPSQPEEIKGTGKYQFVYPFFDLFIYLLIGTKTTIKLANELISEEMTKHAWLLQDNINSMIKKLVEKYYTWGDKNIKFIIRRILTNLLKIDNLKFHDTQELKNAFKIIDDKALEQEYANRTIKEQ